MLTSAAIFLWALLCWILGTLALAQFLNIPLLNFYGGTLLLGWFWVALISAALTITGTCLLAHHSTTARLISTTLALTATCTYTIAGLLQLRMAHRFGARITPSMLLRYTSHSDRPHARFTYTCAGTGETEGVVYYPKQTENAQVIVWIHGGAWVGGSHLQTLHNQWLADQGFIVYSLEYALSSLEEHQWRVVEPQLEAGIAAAAAHASSLGADAARVSIAGESAGGHLALWTGYAIANKLAAHPDATVEGYPLPAIRAVATQYPAVDMTNVSGLDPLMAKWTELRHRQFVGHVASEDPAPFEAIKPANQIGPHTPPTLTTTGSHDDLISVPAVRDFHGQLQRAGVPNELHEVPLGNHGMDLNIYGAPAAIVRQQMLRFFRAH